MTKPTTTRWLAIAILAPMLSLAEAAPKAQLWENWTAHDEASVATIDHGQWSQFLSANVVPDGDGVNRLDYGSVSPADRQRLADYLEGLSEVTISGFNRLEQLAYWINLYNALTVNVVLEHYPVESILDIGISPGLFAAGPWGKKLATVEGEQISLDDLEHRILRPIWRDPRIHYAVNCASVGCPNLRSSAYSAASVEEELDTAAREFINSARAVRVEGGRLYVSSIYEWFKSDFGAGDQAVLAHLRRYARAALLSELASHDEIAGDYYDWTLNSIRKRAPSSLTRQQPGSTTR